MGGRVSAGRQFVVAALAAYWGYPPNHVGIYDRYADRLHNICMAWCAIAMPPPRHRPTGPPSLHRSQNGWEPIAITVGSKSSSIRSRSSHDSDPTCRPSVADHQPHPPAAGHIDLIVELHEKLTSNGLDAGPGAVGALDAKWASPPAKARRHDPPGPPSGEERLGRGVLVG